ncbi:MAG TPA: hypothetical protein VFR53_09925 [Methylomirabilota bacterium]|nr:hypothetical protein [Methylomirabilota bacterium]
MSSSRVFYGWWVTVAFSVMVFVSAGVRHAVGPFLRPMAADLGVDRGSFSLVIALGLEATGGYGAMFAIACVLLATAGLGSLHVDREPRVLRWATLTR